MTPLFRRGPRVAPHHPSVGARVPGDVAAARAGWPGHRRSPGGHPGPCHGPDLAPGRRPTARVGAGTPPEPRPHDARGVRGGHGGATAGEGVRLWSTTGRNLPASNPTKLAIVLARHLSRHLR